MLPRFSSITDKNSNANFDTIFSHLNQYYLGSLSGQEIERVDKNELPYGAIVYDRTNHVLKVLTENEGSKLWKTLSFS